MTCCVEAVLVGVSTTTTDHPLRCRFLQAYTGRTFPKNPQADANEASGQIINFDMTSERCISRQSRYTVCGGERVMVGLKVEARTLHLILVMKPRWYRSKNIVLFYG